MLNRSSRTAIAEGKLGISGTRSKRILEGRCVKTIVLTRPTREATQAAARAEIPARMLALKKIPPRVAGFTPDMEPVSYNTLNHKTARKGIQAKQRA
jgi:hypothetical protein